MPKTVKTTQVEVKELQSQLKAASVSLKDALESLEEARAKEQRALADYQNLVRRTQQERVKIAKMASQELVESLLQPLEHLSLAAEQVNDPGINMVITDLWQALGSQGLREVDALGKKFDVNTMEVVEREGKGETVMKVIKRGYLLNGEVIQHAKVVVGSAN